MLQGKEIIIKKILIGLMIIVAVVVCVGDSITHGRVSHNYVDELKNLHRNMDISSLLPFSLKSPITTKAA